MGMTENKRDLSNSVQSFRSLGSQDRKTLSQTKTSVIKKIGTDSRAVVSQMQRVAPEKFLTIPTAQVFLSPEAGMLAMRNNEEHSDVSESPQMRILKPTGKVSQLSV